MYFQFCSTVIPCVIGRAKFKTKCNIKGNAFSNYCTVTDEAFAILVYTNNYNIWKYKYDLNTKVVTGDLMEPTHLFFDSNKGRGNTYNDSGIHFFNELCERIKDDRLRNGTQFDDELLEYMNQQLGASMKKQKKSDKKQRVKAWVEDSDTIPRHIGVQNETLYL
jgi:hypothetical protein